MELRADERLALAGWAPKGYGEAGNTLFVTCGIGFSRVPIRINAPPQIVFLRLGAGDQAPVSIPASLVTG